MRLLTLTPELPFAPGGSGGSTRQFFLLKRLVELGWEVACVAPVHPSQREGAALLRAAGVDLRAVERPASRVAETLAALRARPGLVVRAATEPLLAWQVDVFWSSMRPLAVDALRERPDVVMVEHDWAARWAEDLPAGVPRALTLHNLSWAYYRARAAAADGPRAEALRAEARRFGRFDRAWLDRYDALLAMSDEDAAAVRSVSARPVHVVPNGVDTASMALDDPPAAPTVLFTGQLGYPPNAEALLWLLRDLWPRISARVPDAKLVVVGRDAPAEAEDLADETVGFAGFVADIRPAFDRASLIAVPMRSGGGTRLKVLDGLASGRPVLSTSIGAAGVRVTDGVDAVLADGADAFVAAAVDLLGNAERRRAIGTAGRRLAETTYDWKVIGDDLAGVLARLAAR